MIPTIAILNAVQQSGGSFLRKGVRIKTRSFALLSMTGTVTACALVMLFSLANTPAWPDEPQTKTATPQTNLPAQPEKPPPFEAFMNSIWGPIVLGIAFVFSQVYGLWVFAKRWGNTKKDIDPTRKKNGP